MKPQNIVISMPVADLQRSLEFYRDGLGLDVPNIEGGVITLELPGLTLFLIQGDEFGRYAQRAGSDPHLSGGAAECILSCALATKEEVDDVVTRAGLVGGVVEEPPKQRNGTYIGYFKDPDGHIWELVWSEASV